MQVEFTRHRAVSQKASFCFLSEGISFSAYSKELSQISFLRFHRNSDFKLLNPKNDLTLWDEYTHHKAVALKASVQFSSEDVSYLTTSLWAPLNIPSQIPQRQSFQTGQRSGSFNSLKWMHKSESSFLERFFLGFISGYFTFCHSLQCTAKYHFADSSRGSFQTWQRRVSFISVK